MPILFPLLLLWLDRKWTPDIHKQFANVSRLQEAAFLQQTKGDTKIEERKRAEIREITAAHHQSTAKLPINAAARALQRRRANWPER